MPQSNSTVSSDIRSPNPKPNMRLTCPKFNTKKRPSHTSFPPPICNLCEIPSVKKTGRSFAPLNLYFHTSCHKPTPPSELAISAWKYYTCLPHGTPKSRTQKSIEQFLRAIATYMKSHHIPVKFPKSVCATVSAAL